MAFTPNSLQPGRPFVMMWSMKIPKAAILAGFLGILCAGQAGAEKDADGSAGEERVDKPLEEQILGYWAPNWDAMSEKWKPLIKGMAELGGPRRSEEEFAAAEKKIAEDTKELCRVNTMEFTKDKFLLHIGLGSVGEEYGYVVKKVDAAAGTIELDMTSSDGAPERGRIVLKGDRLTITPIDEMGNEITAPWILDRIDRQAFEQRQKEAAESKRFKKEGKVPQDLNTPKGKESGGGNPEPRAAPD
jgi:hypothetical protein